MPSRYRVVLTSAARREFAKLSPPIRVRVQTAIDRLRAQPRPAAAEALKGPNGLLRLRVGDHRLIYRIVEDQVLVLVLRIGHRAVVYRATALRLVRRRKR